MGTSSALPSEAAEDLSLSLKLDLPRSGPKWLTEICAGHPPARTETVSARGVWTEHKQPFRHFRGKSILNEEDYARCAGQFQKILDVTEGRSQGPFRLVSGTANYDAKMLGINDSIAALFQPFFGEQMARELGALLRLPFVPRIDGALHSNPCGSRTGWIHTDLCSAWFDESQAAEGKILYPNRSRVNYFTGKTLVPDAEPREYVRVGTLLYYLCNDGWTPGDGGETGLYSAAKETPWSSRVLAAPLSNTAVLFPCSPHSYHRFVTNPRRPRNSIVMWLHAPVDDALRVWGSGINRRSA